MSFEAWICAISEYNVSKLRVGASKELKLMRYLSMTEFLGVTDVPPRVVIRLAGSPAYLAGIIGNVAIAHHRDRTRPSELGEQAYVGGELANGERGAQRAGGRMRDGQDECEAGEVGMGGPAGWAERGAWGIFALVLFPVTGKAEGPSRSFSGFLSLRLLWPISPISLCRPCRLDSLNSLVPTSFGPISPQPFSAPSSKGVMACRCRCGNKTVELEHQPVSPDHWRCDRFAEARGVREPRVRLRPANLPAQCICMYVVNRNPPSMSGIWVLPDNKASGRVPRTVLGPFLGSSGYDTTRREILLNNDTESGHSYTRRADKSHPQTLVDSSVRCVAPAQGYQCSNPRAKNESRAKRKCHVQGSRIRLVGRRDSAADARRLSSVSVVDDFLFVD
ncbi:uncharacterized protein CLUP02_03546 [Colletotrichum lupini]|uniref:Uncharacterized protein n=1 Tax=Colletotrichum lupini TaxID=145971 RepID=A0A9Q8SIM7_9PEZI|nr:uncharacterized protein CLUP02_03546 [Colletotrichum lupini]UQC78072.1 hypothetical protein CLUP02_03546 [Colletotrichum lupini]